MHACRCVRMEADGGANLQVQQLVLQDEEENGRAQRAQLAVKVLRLRHARAHTGIRHVGRATGRKQRRSC